MSIVYTVRNKFRITCTALFLLHLKNANRFVKPCFQILPVGAANLLCKSVKPPGLPHDHDQVLTGQLDTMMTEHYMDSMAASLTVVFIRYGKATTCCKLQPRPTGACDPKIKAWQCMSIVPLLCTEPVHHCSPKSVSGCCLDPSVAIYMMYVYTCVSQPQALLHDHGCCLLVK